MVAEVWLTIGLILLAMLAQKYRVERDWFAEEVLKQYQWIDEIIEALEGEEETD